MVFARTDRSLVGRWWWSIDRPMLAGFGALILIGIVMVLASSPAIARRMHLSSESFFIVRHLSFLLPVAATLFVASLLSPRGVLRAGVVVFALFGTLLVMTLFVAPDIKGAHRWIILPFGLQVQPSEFVKPALAVLSAYLLARFEGLGGLPEAAVLVGLTVGLLVLQPDLGMTVLTLAVFAAQLFVAGLAWSWIAGLGLLGLVGLYGAYTFFGHVRERIDGFLDPAKEVHQVEKAMEAIRAGGVFGRGPGEGQVKFHLPEAHSDFVFATTIEEYGAALSLVIVLIFAFIVLRGLTRAQICRDRFVQLAATGLVLQLGLQAMINMAVNLNLVPTKGMTLPFISYGGSSMLALALGMGMLLALTREGAHLR